MNPFICTLQDICGFKGTLPVAVKVLNSREEAEVRVFTEEAELLKRFSHPNIVSLLGKYTFTTLPHFSKCTHIYKSSLHESI